MSWNAPNYTGGAPVTSYKVAYSARGKPSVTKILTAVINKKTGKIIRPAATTLDTAGLANATTYKVTITAVTVNGISDPYTTTIPIA